MVNAKAKASPSQKPNSLALMLARQPDAEGANEVEMLQNAVHHMDRDELERHMVKVAMEGYPVIGPLTKFANPNGGKHDNGFGIDVAALTFQRFEYKRDPYSADSPLDLPGCIQQEQSWTSLEAAMYAERKAAFIDSFQCELELKDPKMYPQISTSIKPTKVLRQQRQELERIESLMASKREMLSNILGKVHLWRRPHQTLVDPCLFGPGNVILSHVPKESGLHSAADKKGVQRLGAERLTVDKVYNLVKFTDTSIFYDAYFLTAVAMASRNRKVFSNLFASAEFNDVGMYTFQFYSTLTDELSVPSWRCITIDNLIPADSQRKPVLGRLEDPDECWLIYMEKAYAKFLDSYSLLHHGDAASAIIHLTGGFCLLDEWHSDSIAEEAAAIVWWKLLENARHGLLTAAVQIPDKEFPPEDKKSLKMSIRSEADYMEWNESAVVLLNTCEMPVKQVGSQDKVHKIVKMRNLYGHQQWFGEWSNSDKLWTRDLRALAGYEQPQEDDYLQWMRIEDFVKHHNTLLTCQGFAGAPTLFYRHLNARPEGSPPFYALQYLITIVDPTDPNFEKHDANNLELEEDGNSLKKKKAPMKANGANQRPNMYEDSDDDLLGNDSEDDDASQQKVDAMMAGVEASERDLDLAVRDSKDTALGHATGAAGTAQGGAAEKKEKFSFGKMKSTISQGAKEGDAEEEKEEARGPKFIVKFQVSHPPRDLKAIHGNPKLANPKELNVHMFQVKGPGIQPCSYVDTEYEETKIAQEVGDTTFYRFPSNNRIKIKEERSDSVFQMKRFANLTPGHYVLVIYQAQYYEDLHYCLRVDTFDDPMFPTNFVVKVDELGSCADPKSKEKK